jgi:hypothetical protein
MAPLGGSVGVGCPPEVFVGVGSTPGVVLVAVGGAGEVGFGVTAPQLSASRIVLAVSPMKIGSVV